MKRKILTVAMLFAAMLLLCTAANAAGTVVASGYCGGEGDGTNLTWTLDSDGELVITGNGAMIDGDLHGPPWHIHRSEICSIRIDTGMTSIGSYAFQSCSGLVSVDIPDSVTSIGSYAFIDCSSLTSINIPDSVTSIGSGAFGYSSLTSVNIPDSVKSIGSDAFSGCNNLKDVFITDIDAWCKINFENTCATPMSCADNIYCNGSKIVSVTVPEGVTELDYTFRGFKDLIKVIIPINSVTGIGESAFGYCSNLTSVIIPDSVTSIGKGAFEYCSNLTSVTIPDSVTSIGSSAFYECRNLVSVNIPDGVTAINEYTFYSCCKLTSITIPDGVTTIGDYAFYACNRLMSINIPDGVTSIGNFLFYYCFDLTSITIPDSVTSIGRYAFENCGDLTSVTIGSGVTSIGDDAFELCSALIDVYITDMDAWWEISFSDVDANPLYRAKNLYLNGAKVELLEIPESVQVISSYAFYNVDCIKTVAIPKSLVGIAAKAFKNCTGIEKVFYAGSEAEWNELAISAGNECLTDAQIFYNSTPSDYYCMVTCAVSPGGTVSVPKNAYEEGETVAVTATPYTGYELTEIRVDGVKIEGNTFAAKKNHTVLAVFTKLPIYGGTENSRIGDIAVCASDGEAQQTIPTGQCLVTVPVTNLQPTDTVTVMIASYTADGQYQGMAWLTFRNLPVGTTVEATLPLDNSGGKITTLRAFVVGSIFAPIPLGNAVTFGTF